MFPQVLVSSSTIKAQDTLGVERPIANFHPNIWKDHFLSLNFDELKVDDEIEEQAKQLKDEVRKMLISFVGNPLEKLKLIDSIQRLGVYYHFKNEIDQVLEQIYMAYSNLSSNDSNEDLFSLSLLFRLLRQQGYKILPSIFTKFTENNGKFKESLAGDVKGILNLYEAAHMRVHGEDVLEEALDFTIRHLKVIAATSNHRFNVEVSNALKCPLRKAFPRLNVREYMLIYQEHPSHNDTLLNFSKLDFNTLQKLQRKELSEISRWWKDLNFTKKLSFARDRVVEGYFWVLGIQYEPQFSTARKIMTKVFAMVSALDDLYDAYGTYEELQLLTCAIERWEISMIEQLPEYMKFYYKTLLDVYEEYEKELCKNERSYCIHLAKERMKEQARLYMAEAEWLHKGHKPTLEEYLEVALETSGGSFFVMNSFIGMGEAATMETFEWIGKNPKAVKATNIIARLINDRASYEFERERKHIISTVEYYMEKFGCSKDEACVEIYKQVEDAWKELNEACLYPTEIPMVLFQYLLNFSSTIHLIYENENDGYTNPTGNTKTYIQSLLIDPLPY